MSAPPYMKLYVADYLGDTHHLGALEHGAYLLLLMSMWRAGGSLPSADANLAKLARCTPDEWAQIRDVVLPFFQRRGGRITHKRLLAEKAKYDSTSERRSEAGKKGGRKKANENSASVEPIAINQESNCRHNQNQNQNHIEEITSISSVVGDTSPTDGLFSDPQPMPAAPKAKRTGTRLPDDWAPGDHEVVWAGTELDFDQRDVKRITEAFRDYWRAQPGQRGVKADWSATWRNWMRTERDRRPQRRAPASVDWV